MKIELNRKQFKKLTELIYLGNWIANATRLFGERIKEYEEIEQLINSLGNDSNLDFIIHDKDLNSFFTTKDFEEELLTLIDEYDEEIFWQELVSRLALRDLINEIGPVHKLTDANLERRFIIEEKYEKEFEKNGLKNIILSTEE